jgi:hypothetical protein
MDSLGVDKMTTSKRNVRLAFLSALAVGILCFLSPAALAGSKGDTVEVQGVQVLNDNVLVNIVNYDKAPVNVSVTLRVRHTNGTHSFSVHTVTVPAGRNANANFSFGSPVDGVEDLGLSDDMNPI